MVHSCAFVLRDAAENGLVARHVMLCAFGNSPDAVTVVNITGSKQWHRCSAFLVEAALLFGRHPRQQGCTKADSDEAERLRKHPDSWGSRIRMPGKLV
eukprot:s3828_g3.t1